MIPAHHLKKWTRKKEMGWGEGIQKGSQLFKQLKQQQTENQEHMVGSSHKLGPYEGSTTIRDFIWDLQ